MNNTVSLSLGNERPKHSINPIGFFIGVIIIVASAMAIITVGNSTMASAATASTTTELKENLRKGVATQMTLLEIGEVTFCSQDPNNFYWKIHQGKVNCPPIPPGKLYSTESVKDGVYTLDILEAVIGEKVESLISFLKTVPTFIIPPA